MNKPKVLILYNKLFHYRIPVWNILSEYCQLTVSYTVGGEIEVPNDLKFEVMYLPPINGNERFVIQKANIRKLARQFDVVIAYGNIAWLKLSTLPWFNRTKVIFWSLGVSASYNSGYDKKTRWDWIRCFFYKHADALAFYTRFPIEKYGKMGIPVEKMFEAPNTVQVCPVDGVRPKTSILFVGTLYRQKGIQYLLDAYLANRENPNILQLNIIGNGPDYDYIESWIRENGMEHVITLCGAIYDNRQKAEYFADALACISPLQAGLTVLESMGYGVPFITTKDAITGGELFNITNQETGVLMDSPEQLNGILADIFSNPEKYNHMGKQARMYYDENRTPAHMAEGLYAAIQYVLSH